MKKIKLSASIYVSPTGDRFWVAAVNRRFGLAFGIGTGLRYAINDFIDCFNKCKYLDNEGKLIMIDEAGIVKPERPFSVKHIDCIPFLSHKEYASPECFPSGGIFGNQLSIRRPEDRYKGMPSLVSSMSQIQGRVIGNDKCSEIGKNGYIKSGNNNAVKSATIVQ